MVEGQKRFSGTLVGIEDDNIAIDLDNESETALIPFAWLHNAKLVLTDELIRESLSRRAKGDEAENIENALETGKIEIENIANGDETGGE